MKQIIKLGAVGSGNFLNRAVIYRVLDLMFNIYDIECIISGGADGADKIIIDYARDNHREFTEIYSDWQRYGIDAGKIRNGYILDNSDIAVIFWDCKTKGIQNFVEQAKGLGKPYIIIQQLKDISTGATNINDADVFVYFGGRGKYEFHRKTIDIDVTNRIIRLSGSDIYREFKDLCLIHYNEK